MISVKPKITNQFYSITTATEKIMISNSREQAEQTRT